MNIKLDENDRFILISFVFQLTKIHNLQRQKAVFDPRISWEFAEMRISFDTGKIDARGGGGLLP